ncbi:[LysW]-lysine hydrolase [Halobacterium jilantaiense]|uniref:Putative [LysW]-lysine/[LysW]-ornithine hydrolase n=1 Tax=Halobacterium jilantaiense TaxID=355548 RepID=A0A1I0PLV3_9EURY|nr:[LysW]-lysine hydrolase [Halobacterium jilantaiense]SEW15407.1 acetylornithine deacetylase [Halobacterium jilantaiense]
MTPRDLLRDLVSTPSVSGGEGDAADVLVEYFADAGREASIDAAGNVRAPGDDAVLLTSHLDTVPGEIAVRESDGELWGRGSVDATGPLAAMAAAAVETGASFAGVVEEETTSAGARHLVDTRDAPDAVVNGEPTGWDALAVGYRGLVRATYEVETERVHSSRPEPNAVQHAVAWTERVQRAFDEGGEADASAVFDSVTVKPVSFDGGPTADGRGVAATVDVEFRLPPGTTASDVQAVVADCTDSGTVTWTEAMPPFAADARSRVAGALRAGIRGAGGDPTHLRKTGTCDANCYAAAWDCPVAVYGPGDSALDHAPDERIDLDAFDRGVDVLTTAARQLCTS